ncbi:MAG TPA: hypothetical protein VGH74_03095 [Planctomycetaceae bacterium]
MQTQHSRYHQRHGGPGGPGCSATVIPITLKLDGFDQSAELLDAGPNVSELELLRSVAQRLKIHWGQDDAGWWAALPIQK